METKPTNEMPIKATTSTTIHQSKQFPFVIVEFTTTKDEESSTHYEIAVGNLIMSDKAFTTKEMAEEYIASKPWDLIINLIGLTYQTMNENETK